MLYDRGFLQCFWECGGMLAAPCISGNVIHKVRGGQGGVKDAVMQALGSNERIMTSYLNHPYFGSV